MIIKSVWDWQKTKIIILLKFSKMQGKRKFYYIENNRNPLIKKIPQRKKA